MAMAFPLTTITLRREAATAEVNAEVVKSFLGIIPLGHREIHGVRGISILTHRHRDRLRPAPDIEDPNRPVFVDDGSNASGKRLAARVKTGVVELADEDWDFDKRSTASRLNGYCLQPDAPQVRAWRADWLWFVPALLALPLLPLTAFSLWLMVAKGTAGRLYRCFRKREERRWERLMSVEPGRKRLTAAGAY